MNEIKTLDSWNVFAKRTGRGSFYDFASKGDIVDESIIEYFANVLPPKTIKSNFLQIGEPYSYAYDLGYQLRPIYMTFSKCNGVWRYYGNCFAYETVDKTYC